MDYEGDDHPVASWKKVTRKMVDDITFVCSVNIEFVPRIEDCCYETTSQAQSQPRVCCDGIHNSQTPNQNGGANDPFFPAFGITGTSTGSSSSAKKSGSSSSSSKVRSKASSSKSNKSGGGSSGSSSRQDFTQSPPGTKPSLGAFFQKSAPKTIMDPMSDNHSLSSKSMNSRSVADRSNAERSKSEKKLADKKKLERDSSEHQADDSKSSNRGGRLHRQNSKESLAMHSIDELSTADFSVKKDGTTSNVEPKDTGPLGQFLSKSSPISEGMEPDGPVEGETRSVKSGSSRKKCQAEESPQQQQLLVEFSELYLFADRGLCEREEGDDEKSLTLEEVGPGEKQLRFQGGHQAYEIPKLTNSMFDDLFYASDELADFRYEAFLEEAGLDIEEYM